RLAEVIINTGATPSLVSDTAVIPALQKLGISLPDARDYAQVGCLEPTSTGRTFGHTGAILLNVMAALELAGGNGNSRRLEGIGLRTGRLDSFDTFEDFFNAVKQQLEFIIRHATRLNNELGQVWRYLHPQPLLSALFEGPMEHGKSLLDGGATYNSSGIAFIALADLIDSLHAIRQLVFIEKRFTLEQLVNITNDNFKGHDKLHSKVVHKIMHFGNGIEEIDDIGQDLVDFIYRVSTGIKNYRGGPYSPGYWSMTIHSGFGKITGAYPHGKLKGDNFASGLTPVSFGQQQGPTGVFNSLAHLDSSKMPNGMALNMKFSKNLFNSPGKLDIFISLFKAYFKKGGMQVQFTIHDPKILLDARDNPGKYPDLMVRISGYTAYFNDLNEQMKKEIIERALMDL
ncbi:hypothetical protein GF325_04110, partial [Candidatus Bathyarchaeota archaeon]|nr:hypothetical protein [Candidatus Bathyarchaeota archaeon]